MGCGNKPSVRPSRRVPSAVRLSRLGLPEERIILNVEIQPLGFGLRALGVWLLAFDFWLLALTLGLWAVGFGLLALGFKLWAEFLKRLRVQQSPGPQPRPRVHSQGHGATGVLEAPITSAKHGATAGATGP